MLLLAPDAAHIHRYLGLDIPAQQPDFQYSDEETMVFLKAEAISHSAALWRAVVLVQPWN